MKNKKLDPQGFIYLAATNKAFRKKYFAKPVAIAHDFIISEKDLETIMKIDFPKLKSELDSIESDIMKIAKSKKGGLRGNCHNSTVHNNAGNHNSGHHTNSCKGAARILMGKTLKHVKVGSSRRNA